jgi:hypothetical protein
MKNLPQWIEERLINTADVIYESFFVIRGPRKTPQAHLTSASINKTGVPDCQDTLIL